MVGEGIGSGMGWEGIGSREGRIDGGMEGD